jgi:hypothetical protein
MLTFTHRVTILDLIVARFEIIERNTARGGFSEHEWAVMRNEIADLTEIAEILKSIPQTANLVIG